MGALLKNGSQERPAWGYEVPIARARERGPVLPGWRCRPFLLGTILKKPAYFPAKLIRITFPAPIQTVFQKV
jgi:hypothetical protein